MLEPKIEEAFRLYFSATLAVGGYAMGLAFNNRAIILKAGEGVEKLRENNRKPLAESLDCYDFPDIVDKSYLILDVKFQGAVVFLHGRETYQGWARSAVKIIQLKPGSITSMGAVHVDNELLQRDIKDISFYHAIAYQGKEEVELYFCLFSYLKERTPL